MATKYGGAAEDIADPHLSTTDNAPDELEAHSSMGEKVWMFMAATGVLVALAAIPKKAVRVTMLVLAVLAATANAGWIAVTADHGGRHMVYKYGVGVPGSGNTLPAGTQR